MDGIQSPFLTLFDYRLMVNTHKQNSTSVRRVQFGIAKNKIDTGDFDAQYTAINECEELALQVLSRIKYDNYQREHFLYNSYPENPVTILPVELSNEAFGVEVILDLKNPESLKLKPEHWKDIDKIC